MNGFPSEFRRQGSGTGFGDGYGKPSKFRSRSSGTGLGNRSREWTLTVSLAIDSLVSHIPIPESVDQLKVLFNIFHKPIRLLVKVISHTILLSLVIAVHW
jgi:hypothetical protein